MLQQFQRPESSILQRATAAPAHSTNLACIHLVSQDNPSALDRPQVLEKLSTNIPTFVAKRREHRLSFAALAEGATFTNMRVFASLPRQG